MALTPPQLAARMLRTTHTLFLLSIFFYAIIGEKMMKHPAYSGGRMLIVAMAAVAVAVAGAAVVLRSRMVAPSAEALRQDPGDTKALRRWQVGTLTSLVLCESIALCGLALRAVGVSFADVLPFYLAAVLLMLLWRPQLDLPSAGPGAG